MKADHGSKLLLLLIIGASAAACAGTAPPAYGPTTGLGDLRPIAAGETLAGSLAASDPRLEDGSHYDLYGFHGQEGEEIEVTLTSDEFDAYLALGRGAGGDLKIIASDDDGAGQLNARISTVLPRTGPYVLRANSLGHAEMGDYRIELVSHGLMPEPSRTAIRSGETLEGNLSVADARLPDGSYYDIWTLEGTANEVLRIDLVSDDFDSFLAFGTEEDGEFAPLSTDDDGGNELNSRIHAVLPATGRYTVRASSLGSKETGAYHLQLTSQGQARPASRESIRIGEARDGEISATDGLLEDGSFHDVWTFHGTAGETIRLDLSSNEFDSFLQLGTEAGGAFEELASDDDGGAGLDSRLRFILPETREYVVRAQSLRAGRTGTYSIQLRTAEPERPATREPIGLDDPRSGTLAESDSRLDNDAHHDLWIYQGRAGERIRIDLGSDDFDTLVGFGHEEDGRFRQLDTNDDGGDGTDSRLLVTLSEDRPYVIRATSFRAGATGTYRITVSSQDRDG